MEPNLVDKATFSWLSWSTRAAELGPTSTANMADGFLCLLSSNLEFLIFLPTSIKWETTMGWVQLVRCLQPLSRALLSGLLTGPDFTSGHPGLLSLYWVGGQLTVSSWEEHRGTASRRWAKSTKGILLCEEMHERGLSCPVVRIFRVSDQVTNCTNKGDCTDALSPGLR